MIWDRGEWVMMGPSTRKDTLLNNNKGVVFGTTCRKDVNNENDKFSGSRRDSHHPQRKKLLHLLVDGKEKKVLITITIAVREKQRPRREKEGKGKRARPEPAQQKKHFRLKTRPIEGTSWGENAEPLLGEPAAPERKDSPFLQQSEKSRGWGGENRPTRRGRQE